MERNSKREKAAPSGKSSQKEMSIPQALQVAAKHRAAGNLSTAERICHTILEAKQDHPIALHLLGVIAHQSGKSHLAVDLITRAVSFQPNFAEAHNNLGLVQQTRLQHKEAVQSYRKALAIQPDFVQAHSNLGVALRALGKIEEAESCYRRALTLNPDYAEALYNLGNVLKDLNKPEDAVANYRKALGLKPDYSEARNNLGSALKDLGRLDEAATNCQKALELNPNNAEAHNNLGNALRDLGKANEALESFHRALQLKPKYAEAHNNLGATLHELEQLKEATNNYQKALELRPAYAEAHNNLGSALRDLEKIEDAVTSYQRALTLKPDFTKARCNLAHALRQLGKSDEAIDNYRNVLEFSPDFAEAHNGLGNALKEIGKLEAAEASYRHALELDPEFAEAHTNLGMLQLLIGNYSQGWKNYDWRRKVRQHGFRPRDYKQPLWDGGDLAGETIFVHPEQGFGDFFQFVRYIPLIVDRGGKVILEAPEQALQLCKDMNIADKVVTDDSALPAFDYHVPLMNLPKVFGTTLETVPSKTPYLTVSAHLKEKWQHSLGPRQNFRLGIVWASNPKNRKLLHKSIELPLLTPLLQIQDVTVYSLQVGQEAKILEQFRSGITDLAPELTDFSETAGAISQLDLVVSVDTSVAHLAGALGCPVWILLPFIGDWRWLVEREDSPWYPSMRLFRQSKRNDWETVIDQVRIELTETVKHGSP